MNSQDPNAFGWSHTPAFDELVQNVPENPFLSTSGSNNIGTSYRMPHPADEAHDVSMVGNDIGDQTAGPVIGAQTYLGQSHPTKSKSAALDWNGHKAFIKNLYIDQNKSLLETKEAMDRLYSFNASQKLYKTKFKEWNWQKNLSVDTARFMSEKAKRRKREQGKDTVFSAGGRLWDEKRVESTLLRAKKPRVAENEADAPTPEGVSYKTPKALAEVPVIDSDSESSDITISDDTSGDNLDGPVRTKPLDKTKLSLTWKGLSRTDLQNMWQTALGSRNAGRPDEAEDMLHQVFVGLEHVLGKTNEDTVKAAYNLADIFADSGRMDEAIDLVEKVIQNHLDTYGYEDKRTQQNVLQAVELLNGWNRQADALGLLSLSREVLQSSSHSPHARKINHRAGEKGKATQNRTTNTPQMDLSSVVDSISEDLSPARVDYGLVVARKYTEAKEEATETLLKAIISQCEGQDRLIIQFLKARAQLLKLYDKIGQANKHAIEFEKALNSLELAWEAYKWEEDKIESLDFMEAALQLVANVIKYGYRPQAWRLFRRAADKASDLFGCDDERTVWVLITIGLVYQTHLTWNDASEWFEEAFAIALVKKGWGPNDGIVKSLQNAMDKEHFSYVSDEGRPFKTIFGVSGIVVMPGRLHLE